MKNTNGNIANLSQLENVLGVKMSKTTKTTNKTLSEQQQVMQEVKKAMEELLFTKFPQYYKNIESDVIVTSKEGKHSLRKISGNYLLFKQDVKVGNKTQEGYKICKPTTYVKGGNSYSCLYYKEIGKTTINK
jgi:hypothetical protein